MCINREEFVRDYSGSDDGVGERNYIGKGETAARVGKFPNNKLGHLIVSCYKSQ